jgi:ribosome modulation factor
VLDMEIDRDRLRQFVADEGEKIEARENAVRLDGKRARSAGLVIAECPYSAGSYMSILWLEGWSGTRAPRRRCVAGGAFNMTPQQDIETFADWIMSLALPADFAASALLARRDAYREEFSPTLN